MYYVLCIMYYVLCIILEKLIKIVLIKFPVEHVIGTV